MEFTLKFSEKQMDIVANALGMRPYVEVAQLLQSITQQIQAQQPQVSPPQLPNGAADEQPPAQH
jgi:hypothetical protein